MTNLLQTRCYAILPRLLACAMLLTAVPLGAQSPTVRILQPERVAELPDGGWEIIPAPVGLGGLPAPMLETTFDAPLRHDPRNVLEAVVRTSAPVDFVVVAQLEDGGAEVFPSRRAEPSDEARPLRWSIDDRIGNPPDIAAFRIGVVTESTPTSFTLVSLRIADSSALSDAELIAASSYRAVNVKYHEFLAGVHQQQEATIVLPAEVAMRHSRAKLVLRLNDTVAAERDLAIADISRRQLVQRLPLRLEQVPAAEYRLEAYLAGPAGESLMIGEQNFRRIEHSGPIRQFESPYQSIESYAVHFIVPDMVVLAVQSDLFARDEPPLVATATHEIIAHTVSLASGRYESQPAWRMSAYNNWAAGGFRSIGRGSVDDAHAFYVSGADAYGVESLGMASTVGAAAVRPSISNPVFDPDPALIRWREGMSAVMRGNALAPYGRSRLLLQLVQAGEQPPLLVASLTPDMRSFADAGVPPSDIVSPSGHLDLSLRGGIYYLLADDTQSVWVSRDPLRNWERRRVELPETWTKRRLIARGDEWFLFGLDHVEGRAILRFQPVTWSRDEIPLPIVGEDQ